MDATDQAEMQAVIALLLGGVFTAVFLARGVGIETAVNYGCATVEKLLERSPLPPPDNAP